MRLPPRSSVFGGGLLERARSMTLALLGVTAAVGLGIVAVALNQSWPLVAGSPIPGAPEGGKAVGEARVASPAGNRTAGGDPAGAGRTQASDAGRGSAASPGAPEGSPPGSTSPGSSEFVSASTPVGSRAGSTPRKPAQAAPDPPPPQAKPQPPVVAAQPPPPSQEPAPPTSAAEDPSPTATASAAPPEEESSVPSWSHGGGHAYGRSDRERDDHGHGDWDDRGGRDRSHGRRWDD